MKKFVLVVAFLLGAVMVFAQNGTKLIGYDAKTSGRGGTGTGIFDANSLIMTNPAGLCFVKEPGLELGISLMAPKVHYNNSINNADGQLNYFPLGTLSYVAKPKNKFTYGLGVFTQGGMGADFSLNHQLYRNESGWWVQQPYHSKFAVMQAGGAVAYQLNKMLSVGATATVVYGQVEFQMPMSMSPVMLKGVINPGNGSTFGAMFGSDPSQGGLGYTEVVASASMRNLNAVQLNGKIGVAFRPSDKFSAGITYTLPVQMHFRNGIASMDMSYQMNDAFSKVVAGIMAQHTDMPIDQAQLAAMAQFSALGIDLSKGASDIYASRASFGLPQSLAAGFAVQAGKQLQWSADVEWSDWSHAFDVMDIGLKSGTNPNINRMMGTDGSFTMQFPLEWKNTITVKTGFEYEVNKCITTRVGYAYGNNPVPAETVFPVFPAVVKHHAMFGGSFKVGRKSVLNFAYEQAFKNEVQAAAISHVGSQYNNSTSALKNEIWHLSLHVGL